MQVSPMIHSVQPRLDYFQRQLPKKHIPAQLRDMEKGHLILLRTNCFRNSPTATSSFS